MIARTIVMQAVLETLLSRRYRSSEFLLASLYLAMLVGDAISTDVTIEPLPMAAGGAVVGLYVLGRSLIKANAVAAGVVLAEETEEPGKTDGGAK